jgi:hypothetical protein
MPWYLPSYGRPDAPGKMLLAPGGMPPDVVVLVNADDPAHNQYVESSAEWPSTWRFLTVPAGSRFASAVGFAYEQFSDAPHHGIADDDYWPVTSGWYDKMIEAAGPNGIAIANNKINFPAPYTCRVMGGALARAIGTIAPGKMRHNFSDDAWGSFGSDFKIMRALEDTLVEHHHHSFGLAEKDDTYQRGSADFEEDRRRFLEWLCSDERREQCKRVAALLGSGFTVYDFRNTKLMICVPVQNTSVDIAFHYSMESMTRRLAACGITFGVQYHTGGSHIGKAREVVLWQALKAMPDATHVLFIDDDMGWNAELTTRLLAADHEFAAASGVKKVDTPTVCFNGLPDTLHPVTKFLKVRHIGFAFVLLKRSVIDKLCAAYPELEYNTDGNGREWALFFDLLWKQAGRDLPERLSEDLAFCERWGRIGGEIWMDQHASLIHAGRKEYTGSPAEIMAMRNAS